MRRRRRSILCAAAVALAAWGAAPAGAATTIRLATVVPEGTIWDQALREMGAEWELLSEGRVDLVVYPGATQGDEPTVLKRMRIGQLQAAALTVAGLSEIDPAFAVFEIPFFFRSYEELYGVLEALTPTLRQRLAQRGYALLNWGHAGWVHLFSKKPVASVGDLRDLRLFVWAGDDRMVQWWKSQGFHPVALSISDVLTGLQSGMIDVYYTTPLAALALQWYRPTPFMADIGLAPLVGATIVKADAWRRVALEDRSKLEAAAGRLEQRLEEGIPAADRQAVEEMKAKGLKVIEVEGTPREAEFRRIAEEFAARMRGGMVPAEVYDLAVRARDELRRQAAGGKQTPGGGS